RAMARGCHLLDRGYRCLRAAAVFANTHTRSGERAGEPAHPRISEPDARAYGGEKSTRAEPKRQAARSVRTWGGTVALGLTVLQMRRPRCSAPAAGANASWRAPL